MKNLKICVFSLMVMLINSICAEITPYKFTDEDMKKGGPNYNIPADNRFILQRSQSTPLIYYFSQPSVNNYPIAVLCGGSSHEESIMSIIHLHRYFLSEFLELGVGVLTVEQAGVDGKAINVPNFMENYTRSNRLLDHRQVIDALIDNPPSGWNGQLIFVGVSEGGALVTTLTTDYGSNTLATINWSGAGDFLWTDELWIFIEDMWSRMPWYVKLRSYLPAYLPFSLDLYHPKSREAHNAMMCAIAKNPTTQLKLAGMTYQYHADILNDYPKINYEAIKTPYLVVSGEKDSFVTSSDAFVEKAIAAGAPITYMRIADMDHYIRKRPDIVQASFDWLKKYL